MHERPIAPRNPWFLLLLLVLVLGGIFLLARIAGGGGEELISRAAQPPAAAEQPDAERAHSAAQLERAVDEASREIETMEAGDAGTVAREVAHRMSGRYGLPFVVGTRTGTWQIVLVPLAAEERIRIEAYGAGTRLPEIMTELEVRRKRPPAGE